MNIANLRNLLLKVGSRSVEKRNTDPDPTGQKSSGWAVPYPQAKILYSATRFVVGRRVRLDVTAMSGEEIGDVTTVYSEGLVEAGPDVTPTTKRNTVNT